jgi:ABC-type multidrug transport system ATPase subunit
MRRRLDLGASLVGRPHLLLLDEPTTGLDPRSRLELWDAINELVSSGTDVLLTTQYLEEADQLATHVVIIDHGRVIAAGTPDQLKAQTGRDVVQVHPRHAADIDAVAGVLAHIGDDAPRVDHNAKIVTVGVDNASQLIEAVRRLDEAGVTVDDIALRRPTLDEVFLHLTGHMAEDATDTEGAAR